MNSLIVKYLGRIATGKITVSNFLCAAVIFGRLMAALNFVEVFTFFFALIDRHG